MNIKKLRLGLIGKDVSKSTSGAIHRFILSEFGVECEYQSFSITPQDLDSTMRRLLGDFDGFNVTIPYKRDVFEYLDGVDGSALNCGAVNTVLSATRVGYNTDVAGFMLMLTAAGITVKNKKVLVLGAGGAGRSSAVALKDAGAQVFMYRRNRAELEEVCSQLGVQAVNDPERGGFDVVINSTGVGMHDTEGVSPVGVKAFDGATVAVDLIYTPKQSKFLSIASEQGLQTLNGEAMLFYQAYYADCLYLNYSPSEEQAKTLYKKYQNSIQTEKKV